MRTTNRPTTDVAEPRVASCIRFDHRQATHLLLHRSSASHKDGMRLQRQITPGTDPLRAGFPRGRTHPLDWRRPSHPSKRPTREASEPGRSLKAPFQPLTFLFPSERVTTSPWVRTHFVAKGPVKELLTLKPVRVKRFTREARRFLERPEKFPPPPFVSTLLPRLQHHCLSKREEGLLNTPY